MMRRRPWLAWVMIVVGTGLLAVGIQNIFEPADLVTGGFTGIAIIVKNLTEPYLEGGIPLWLTNLALNMPLFLIAWRVKGKSFIGRTAVATLLLSAWLFLLPKGDLMKGDHILACVFGGLIAGAGIGLILQARATTGGTDMVAALVHHKLRQYSIVQILMAVDGIVVLCGTYLFGVQASLYAIVAIFASMKASDGMMEGFRYAKAAYIITDRYQEVAEAIMRDMNRGVTGLEARGMYSGQGKCMLYCVVSRKEIVALKELALGIDRNAFVIVNDVREALGEGFLEYHNLQDL